MSYHAFWHFAKYASHVSQTNLVHTDFIALKLMSNELNIASGNEFNTLRPSQNGPQFADDILKWIFFNENIWILIKLSLKFVPNGQQTSIGSGNGLALNRRQAIIWTNQGLVYWCINASLSLIELKITST